MIAAETDVWRKLLSCKRINDLKDGELSKECIDDPRNPFQRDCDKITYSYPFRRLQDKTQVIPLPVMDFVHTRLTHTLEVTTVGRSLGKLLENHLFQKGVLTSKESGSIPAIVAAACLAHDIGNPPFGHSGEDSISEYYRFKEGLDHILKEYGGTIDDEDKYHIKDISSECKIRDLQTFEGNAMGFRLLTRYEDSGMNLTCATLATFTKYPRQSFIEGEEILGVRWNTERVSQKKYGFFQAEANYFKIVAQEVGLKQLQDPNTGNLSWARHPLAFLMEAADDICYRIIDLEDGFRIGRIPFKEAERPLLLLAQKDSAVFDEKFYNSLPENRSKKKFTYLRSRAINVLVQCCFEAFKENYDQIMSFEFDKDLITSTRDTEIISALDSIRDIVKKNIYKWDQVLAIEAAGFEILGSLLSEYTEASNICLECPEISRSKRASKILDLLDDEHRHTDVEEPYERYLKIACYISGMTDSFAVNLFQKIRGIKT